AFFRSWGVQYGAEYCPADRSTTLRDHLAYRLQPDCTGALRSCRVPAAWEAAWRLGETAQAYFLSEANPLAPGRRRGLARVRKQAADREKCLRRQAAWALEFLAPNWECH